MILTGPASLETALITADKAPSLPAFKIAIAGMIVINIPANSFATSCIGNQLNSFASLISDGVSFKLAKAKINNKASLVKF